MPASKRTNEDMDEGSRKRARVLGDEGAAAASTAVIPRASPKPSIEEPAPPVTVPAKTDDTHFQVSLPSPHFLSCTDWTLQRHSNYSSKTLTPYDLSSLAKSVNDCYTNPTSCHVATPTVIVVFQHGLLPTKRKPVQTAEWSSHKYPLHPMSSRR